METVSKAQIEDVLETLDVIGAADQVPGHVNNRSKRRMAELARECADNLRTALRFSQEREQPSMASPDDPSSDLSGKAAR